MPHERPTASLKRGGPPRLPSAALLANQHCFDRPRYLRLERLRVGVLVVRGGGVVQVLFDAGHHEEQAAHLGPDEVPPKYDRPPPTFVP